MFVGFALQERVPRAAAAVTQPQVLDPPASHVVGKAAPAHSVRQQADDVLHVIQYGSLRKDICDGVRLGTIGRDVILFKLDELHGLSLKSAVAAIEPNSAAEIGNMKKWAMSTLARPGPMALVEDKILFNFIAKKLMAQDESLADESVVDEEFATFLARSNSVQKALTATIYGPS
jgi:hypothetical protein